RAARLMRGLYLSLRVTRGPSHRLLRRMPKAADGSGVREGRRLRGGRDLVLRLLRGEGPSDAPQAGARFSPGEDARPVDSTAGAQGRPGAEPADRPSR